MNNRPSWKTILFVSACWFAGVFVVEDFINDPFKGFLLGGAIGIYTTGKMVEVGLRKQWKEWRS